MRTATESRLRRLIKSRMAEKNYTNAEVAIKMHLSPSAWDRRLNHPGRLTFTELERLDRVLGTGILRGG